MASLYWIGPLILSPNHEYFHCTVCKNTGHRHFAMLKTTGKTKPTGFDYEDNWARWRHCMWYMKIRLLLATVELAHKKSFMTAQSFLFITCWYVILTCCGKQNDISVYLPYLNGFCRKTRKSLIMGWLILYKNIPINHFWSKWCYQLQKSHSVRVKCVYSLMEQCVVRDHTDGKWGQAGRCTLPNI